MNITQQIVVFDAPDLAAESGFWAALTGGTVTVDDVDWHTVHVDGEPRLAVQLVPDHVRPAWPSGTPQQMHLDLYVKDIRAAHAKALSVGAELLQAAKNIDAKSGFQVYADPAGHPFCLCWG
jgi:predicted enzyme related to lactoylglutathione lyase